ncbi:putative S-adenosyl-L-methionine-dependent methyltransferase [Medicago truncatula]|uniref:Peptide upstream ORF protein, putative n=1 Tax=Medicago truncatula TaxID=3880 RepID=A0A072VVY5_MEDTR|nr:uncharacterized protein LOC25484018 [Medicago truncatula]KEH42250.1 peptide upstream ORF protein, putative [Medicago truncatula]RHN79808.1 putative S-adenosyl-L-methionine-dependent methyltransferase [Medicago truncatula]
MDSNSKCSRFQIPLGSMARSMFFKALLLASAISIVSLLHLLPSMDLAPKTYDHDCIIEFEEDSNLTLTPGSYLFQSRVLNSFWGSFDSLSCKKEINLVSSIVKELKGERLLNFEAETLCIGETSNIAVSTLKKLGFTNVINHRVFSFNKKNFVYSLDHHHDESFDFVLSKDLGKVAVPALVVLEVERILKPNGIGALLLDFDDNDNINMIRYASPISALLRNSSIVHVSLVNNHGLVVFKKKSESKSETESENRSSLFYHQVLPEDCKSVNFAKQFMNLIEPPLAKETPYQEKTTYLPKFKDVSSSKKNLVYVNIVEDEVGDWFPQSYPIHKKDFNVYFVHYNTSIMLSHVKGPRVTFVYHPELNENFKDEAKVNVGEADVKEDEEFDLVAWFKETVENADFVMVKMNIAGKVEMKFLSEIYKNGVICFVDELFLSCSESEDGERERCMDIYKGLRSNGVFVHQWWNTHELHQRSNV